MHEAMHVSIMFLFYCTLDPTTTTKDQVDDGYELAKISESRNPFNEGQLEVAHRDVKYTLKREVGVRLNLKCGGANYKEEDFGEIYGVYILYNLKGFLSYLILSTPAPKSY